jgi:hypothetical protein
MNPAPALTPAGEELARLAVAAILSHERKSPDSENEPRGNESHLRPALADVLGGAGPFHPGGHQAPQRTAAAARQIAVLGKIAVNRDFGQEAGRGGEHLVYRRPGDRDVLKLTLPDAAVFGFVLDVADSLLWLRPAIASEYLGRLGLMDAASSPPVTAGLRLPALRPGWMESSRRRRRSPTGSMRRDSSQSPVLSRTGAACLPAPRGIARQTTCSWATPCRGILSKPWRVLSFPLMFRSPSCPSPLCRQAHW